MLVKIPNMEKEEYDELIRDGFMSRIAFNGREYPHVAPFLYVFDGKFMYFLPSRYGKKIKYFKRDPNVIVEVETYASDLSSYRFVTLIGTLVEVRDQNEKDKARQMFVDMIKDRGLSNKVMMALGHSPDEPLEAIKGEDRTMVWKLVDVREITALKNRR